MGVASLGGMTADTSTCVGTAADGEEGEEGGEGPDFAGARYYLETAQQMIERLREEAAAQDSEERALRMAEGQGEGGAQLEPYCPQVRAPPTVTALR